MPSFIRRVCSGYAPGWGGLKLGWGEPVEARVRSVGVVVDPPFFDDPACLGEAGEEVLVETLVALPAVEALDKALSRIGLAGAM
jgi:hypothetical protein